MLVLGSCQGGPTHAVNASRERGGAALSGTPSCAVDENVEPSGV